MFTFPASAGLKDAVAEPLLLFPVYIQVSPVPVSNRVQREVALGSVVLPVHNSK